jgi:hypothetical protein
VSCSFSHGTWKQPVLLSTSKHNLIPLAKFLGMPSNLWLCSIALLLAAQGAKAQVTADPVTCVGNIANVNNALQEAVNIAEFAYQRQVGLRDGTLSNADWRVAINTFNAYFGVLAAPGTLTRNGALVAPNAVATGDTLISKSSYNRWLFS